VIGSDEPPPSRGEADRDAAPVPVSREPRPWIERIGLAGIALVLAILFGAVAAAAWSGGEVFIAAMGAVGCLMTVWVGVLTIVRG
jgi:hypothetical protein